MPPSVPVREVVERVARAFGTEVPRLYAVMIPETTMTLEHLRAAHEEIARIIQEHEHGEAEGR